MTQNLNSACDKATGLILLLVIAGVLYLLSPVLIPFVFGALLAYLFNPLVIILMRFKLTRTMAVSFIFLLIIIALFLIVLLLIPLIENQVLIITDVLPKFVVNFKTSLLPTLLGYLNIQEPMNVAAVKSMVAENIMKTGGDVVTWLGSTMLQSGKTFFEIIINLFLIPIVAFYLLRDWNSFLDTLLKFIPRKSKPTVIKLAKESDTVLGAFFRGQLLVMLALCVFYSIGLTLVGLKTGLIIGLIVGLLSIVPYLGVIIGVLIACVASIAQLNSMSSLVWILLVFIIGHILEGFVLSPNLIGNRIGLHPVAVIFAIFAGACLFGFFGVLLALPVATVVMVLLRHLHNRYQLNGT